MKARTQQVPAPDEWQGWHWQTPFSCPEGRFRAGITQRVKPPVAADKQGFEACREVRYALSHASSSDNGTGDYHSTLVARVRLTGQLVDEEEYELFGRTWATERTILWVVDASAALHEWGCEEAERALHLLQVAGDDPRPLPEQWEAIAIKRAWLRGEATDDEVRAARKRMRQAYGAQGAAFLATRPWLGRVLTGVWWVQWQLERVASLCPIRAAGCAASAAVNAGKAVGDTTIRQAQCERLEWLLFALHEADETARHRREADETPHQPELWNEVL